MSTEYFTFHSDGRKTGGIIRIFRGDYVASAVVFAEPHGMYLTRQCTQFNGGGIRDWSTFTFYSETEGTRVNGKRTHDGVVVIDNIAYPELGDSLPGYAVNVMVPEFVASGDTQWCFREFHDSEPTDVVDACLERCGMETVSTPYGMLSGMKVTLNRDGVVATTYWCDGSEVSMVDWQGAQSYRVADLETLLVGLPEPIAAELRAFDGANDPACV